MQTSHKIINKLFEKSLFIRRVEEFVSIKCKEGMIDLPIHLSIGQELVSVAICQALRNKDYIWGTYRSHALFLARSLNLSSFFGELLGKEIGPSSGFGGSMHLHSVQKRIIGASGIVATNITNSLGFAYAQKIQKKNNLTCAFFGDGATDTGIFYEALNFASLKKIPIIFVMEDNNLAIRTKLSLRQSGNIKDKVKAFGVEYFESSNNLKSFLRKLDRAIKYALKNSLPVFVKLETIRWYQHLGFEYELDKNYRNPELEEKTLKHDQINIWLNKLNPKKRAFIEKEINNKIQRSWKLAVKSNFPNMLDLHNNIR